MKSTHGYTIDLQGYNGKPVLLTKSSTLYTGEKPGGVKYAGMDINMRCWAYAARKALKECGTMVPKMLLHVGFVIEVTTEP